jgi:hypothetical protein
MHHPVIYRHCIQHQVIGITYKVKDLGVDTLWAEMLEADK